MAKQQGKGKGNSMAAKKTLAFELYMGTDLTQKEIAEKVGVTEKTIGNWKEAGMWELLKTADTVTRHSQIRDFMLQLKELNDGIKNRESGKRYANAMESDTISKLTNAIAKLDRKANLSDYVAIFDEFLKYLRAENLDTAKMIVDYQYAFLQIKATELADGR